MGTVVNNTPGKMAGTEMVSTAIRIFIASSISLGLIFLSMEIAGFSVKTIDALLFTPFLASATDLESDAKFEGNIPVYHYYSEKVTYQVAKERCHHRGYTLVMPKTEELEEKIRTTFASLSDRFWIGAEDESREVHGGNHTWNDGSPVTWGRWDTDQPNHWGHQHCVQIHPKASWTWNDVSCNKKQSYMCQGPIMHMEAVPDTMTPLLTPNLTLTCAVDTSGLAPFDSETGSHSKHVTSAAEDLTVISSIAILHTSGAEVAVISDVLGTVIVENDGENAVAEGCLNSTRRYLSITWHQPTQSQSGQYMCQVSGVSREGEEVTYKTSTHVTAHDTSVAELVRYIQDMEHRRASYTKQKDSEILELQRQISSLQAALQHVENGSLLFDQRFGDWGENYTYSKSLQQSGMQHQEKTVIFSKPYDRPPVITWNIVYMERYRKYLMYSVELVEVTSKSFTIRAARNKSDNFWFYRLVIEWSSTVV